MSSSTPHQHQNRPRRPSVPRRRPPAFLSRISIPEAAIPFTTTSSSQESLIDPNPTSPKSPITTTPLSFDGSEWYADDAFPKPTTIPQKLRYQHEYSASAPDITYEGMFTLSSPCPSPKHYPRRSSPLTLPPLPEDPTPNVPVPFPSHIEPTNPYSGTSSPSTYTLSSLSRVASRTRNKLKKKRKFEDEDDESSTFFAQMGRLFAKTDKPDPEAYPTPNLLVLRCYFIEKYIPRC